MTKPLHISGLQTENCCSGEHLPSMNGTLRFTWEAAKDPSITTPRGLSGSGRLQSPLVAIVRVFHCFPRGT